MWGRHQHAGGPAGGRGAGLLHHRAGGRVPPRPEAVRVQAAAAPGDWLAAHAEPGQSFEDYVRGAPARPTAARDVIVLQPIGPFEADDAALLETLRDYLAAFYQLQTRIAEPLPLPAMGMRARDMGGETIVQYRADLIEHALKPRLPPDAVAYLGITMSDLFADMSWEFIFGLASLERRVGVFSLARYRPGLDGEPVTPAARRQMLWRALIVMAHETGHMFSLPHCAAYECLMNGVGVAGRAGPRHAVAVSRLPAQALLQHRLRLLEALRRATPLPRRARPARCGRLDRSSARPPQSLTYSNQSKSAGAVARLPLPVAYRPIIAPVK